MATTSVQCNQKSWKIPPCSQSYQNFLPKSGNETTYNSTQAAQISQNKELRLLDGSKIKDRRSVAEMLLKFDFLSVNQISAHIKIQDAWKAGIIQACGTLASTGTL